MPKTVEVDETQLQASEQLRATIAAMMQKPESRRLVQQAQKIAFPNAVIPEIDAAKPVMDEVEKVRKEFQDKWDAREKADKERDENARVDRLKGQWAAGQSFIRDNGYDDEGLKAIEDFMQKHGVADHKIALAAFEREHPPATPATPQGQGTGSWQFFAPPPETAAEKKNAEFMEKMVASKGEDERALDAQVWAAINEVRAQRRAA